MNPLLTVIPGAITVTVLLLMTVRSIRIPDTPDNRLDGIPFRTTYLLIMATAVTAVMWSAVWHSNRDASAFDRAQYLAAWPIVAFVAVPFWKVRDQMIVRIINYSLAVLVFVPAWILLVDLIAVVVRPLIEWVTG